MNIILMGPPGAGKGTQAKNLVKKYGLTQISSGDLFRAAIAEENSYGVIAKYFIQHGHLVPDDFTIQMMRERLAKKDWENGFILDGFPRTIIQARELESICREFGFQIDAIINLECDFENLKKRLAGRRTCKQCGTTYHVLFNPSKVAGVCDKCGGELYQRTDESEEAVAIRLNTYLHQTRPLIGYYTAKGSLININGDQSMEDVFEDIEKSLEVR